MRTWTFSLLLSLMVSLLSLVACTGPVSKPSFLIIAVDQLGSHSIDCSKEVKLSAPKSGFEVLCREFSRWTHAYTPSPLSVPALTSLLTGEYPLSHGVRHNGNQFLPAGFETVAELAFKNSWSTFFVSGGAPVFRKSGLSQGFEVFDDSIKPTIEYLYRPFQIGIQLYLTHLKEIGQQQSFSVVYVPDLAHYKTQTRNSLGELRNLSYESQLEQFDEDLARLFENLKSIHRWDDTHIVILGLSAHGRAATRKTHPFDNLHGEFTQVALFTKWAGETPSETHDENLTLADLGATLFTMLGSPRKEIESSEFPIYSIKKAKLDGKRWIPLETGWPAWHKKDEIHWAFRQGPLICLKTSEPQCFNSLIDREEVLPLSKSDFSKIELSPFIQKVFAQVPIEASGAIAVQEANNIENACYQIVKHSRFQTNEMRKCDDSSVLDLAQLIADDQNPQVDLTQREVARRKFAKTFWYYKLDEKIEETNRDLGLVWDLSPDRTQHRKLFEEVLNLPEVQKYKAQAIRSFSEDERN